MRICFLIVLILFLLGSQAFAIVQKLEISANKQNTLQTDYSESTSYKPREFPNNQKSKQKKEKREKRDSEKKVQNALGVEAFPKAENKLIEIPVSVFDQNGKPFKNLNKSNFRIFIDDKEQEIVEFKTQEEPLNIFLVVDTSPSILYKIENIRNFVSEFIVSVPPNSNLQIFQFDQQISSLNRLTGDPVILNKAVKKLAFGDGTAVYESIVSLMRKYVSAVAGRKIIILLSDGVDTVSRESTYETSLIEVEKNDAVVFPFYVDTYEIIKTAEKNSRGLIFNQSYPMVLGSKGTLKEEYILGGWYLNDLASLSGGKMFQVKDLSKVDKRDFLTLRESLTPQYSIGFAAPPPSDNSKQRHFVKVRIDKPNLIVRARGSYVLNGYD